MLYEIRSEEKGGWGGAGVQQSPKLLSSLREPESWWSLDTGLKPCWVKKEETATCLGSSRTNSFKTSVLLPPVCESGAPLGGKVFHFTVERRPQGPRSSTFAYQYLSDKSQSSERGWGGGVRCRLVSRWIEVRRHHAWGDDRWAGWGSYFHFRRIQGLYCKLKPHSQATLMCNIYVFFPLNSLINFVNGFQCFSWTKLSGISASEKSHSLKIRGKKIQLLIPSLHNSVIVCTYLFSVLSCM